MQTPMTVRVILVLAALLGCASGRRAAAPSIWYAGTWQGRFLAPGSDSILVRWTWSQSADTLGAFTFGRETLAAPTRLSHVGADSAVVDLLRPVRPMQIVGAPEFAFRLIVRARDSIMTGLWVATPPTGPAYRGRLEATRISPRR